MANDPVSSNSFLRAAQQVQASRASQRAQAVAIIQPKTSAAKRARLNHIPDDDTLFGLIDQALSALARGIRWARGSIVNLIV